MAYLEARAGIARAGVTYAGFAAPRWQITVNGTDRTTEILRTGFDVRRSMNDPLATFTFRALDWVPVAGHRVLVKYCTPDEYLFTGFLVRVTLRVQAGTEAVYDCEAVSDLWLMDLIRPQGRVHAMGLRAALEWLVGQLGYFENPKFTVGSVPSSMADIAAEVLDGSRTTSQVISAWVAQTTGAFWRLRLTRAIDVFVEDGLPDGNGATIGNSTAIGDLVVQQDLSQVVTKAFALGPAAQVTTSSRVGTYAIAVDDCAKFLTTVPEGESGTTYGLLHRYGWTQYSAASPASGPGTLTCSELTEDVPEGSEIRHLVIYADTTASEALATLLGETYGIAERWIYDEAASAAACKARAVALLEASKTQRTTITYRTTERWVTPGQWVELTVTSPVTVSGTYVVDSVRTIVRGAGTSTRADLWHVVTLQQTDRRVFQQFFWGPYLSPMTPPGFALPIPYVGPTQPYVGPMTPPGFITPAPPASPPYAGPMIPPGFITPR